MVNPTKVPIINPINELENTKTNASYMYKTIILFLFNPIDLRIEISLDYSIIFADIEEVREKKHKNITIIITTVKITFINF